MGCQSIYSLALTLIRGIFSCMMMRCCLAEGRKNQYTKFVVCEMTILCDCGIRRIVLTLQS